MTLEVLNTIASIGTLIVIAATAIAALGQLRHMRGSNQIQALTECREVLESETFAAAIRFVQSELPRLVEDRQFRERLNQRPLPADLAQITVVANFFESMGAFVKHDIIDETIACDLWANIVVINWSALQPVIAIFRRQIGSVLWENFEYLVTLCEDHQSRNPRGAYPRGVRRKVIVDTYADDVNA